jgi:hypothetical protein
MRLCLLVAVALGAAIGSTALDAGATAPRPAVSLALALDARAYPPSTFEAYRPLTLATPDWAPRRSRPRYVHSLGWVGTVMGASAVAVGTTFFCLGSLGSAGGGDASVATRTMAATDRTVGAAGLLGGAVMLTLGIVALVMTGTDVRKALDETITHLPDPNGQTGRPALKLAF